MKWLKGKQLIEMRKKANSVRDRNIDFIYNNDSNNNNNQQQ